MSTHLAIQISPEAKAAYFSDYIEVCQKEIIKVIGEIEIVLEQVGLLDFLILNESDLLAQGFSLNDLLRLSFVQGVFKKENDALVPLDLRPDFKLHEDFVFGSKFKGKTNERLTQLLINVGLSELPNTHPTQIKLLDPMCGRATTLLWAMRYGINSIGIEPDKKAQEDIKRNVKKWTKIHRQKHKFHDGWMVPDKKKRSGQFLDFVAEDVSMRVINGDARNTDKLIKKDKFDLIISDLPYGVQHFSSDNMRNPIDVIRQCIEPWKSVLKKKGVIVLAYNRNNPKRKEIVNAFEESGMQVMSFEAGHRMSESIVRDVIIVKNSS